ncbi:hypothetical protein tinsulaeT_37900 [Thalassotalea insulae]|uniref:Periplasmic binding protein domain-containing protein n=1 Tax=Thalassotalea insulae TaxID=2056778 RepID=A0ABQ6H084_9GAMM|nr:ABC transporter substrate-binding protein [Thalassotalea insulae]GLX80450.1 hypothetical protein tinsulaeT_37900 [Thalassotalea insulae]
MRNYLRCLLLLAVLSVAISAQADSVKVVFLNPGYPEQNTTGNFWRNVSDFMQVAADDLSIELTTLYACRDHILMKSLVDKLISYQPDYVVLVNEKGVVSNMVRQLARHNISIFFLLNRLNKKEFDSLTGHEKQVIKGSVIPDNFIVGQQLLQQLVQRSEKISRDQTADNKVQPKYLLALQGDFTTPASLAREQGFKQAFAKTSSLYLLDSTVANWSKQQAYQKVTGLLKRSRIDIIWAANDAMAFGAKQAVDEAKLNYPVVIGGVNWDIGDVNYPLDISFGGHVTLGAYAMVMIKDIADKRLPEAQHHQIINIFAPSTAPYYQAFVKHLADRELAHYDFTVFTQQHPQHQAFSIVNLVSAFAAN